MTSIVQVAVPVPLRKVFDYTSKSPIKPGVRVSVPFGRRVLLGIVISNQDPIEKRKLKQVIDILDTEPVFSPSLFEMLRWASLYYHYPVGEVLNHALPTKARKTQALFNPDIVTCYRTVTDDPLDKLNRSPAQLQLFQFLQENKPAIIEDLNKEFKSWRPLMNKLIEKGLAECLNQEVVEQTHSLDIKQYDLNKIQHDVTQTILADLTTFKPYLLQGVTGSGKTEVYMWIARRVIEMGKQVLILVPEIALTPQLSDRVTYMLGGHVEIMHSGLTEQQRYQAWWRAKNGKANAVLGTRSAIFTALSSPGLIIVDEEHDLSYKQQDNFRYHARDIAIKRASLDNIPIILGSATPSLESLYNAQIGKYSKLVMAYRFGRAELPPVTLLDTLSHKAHEGLSTPLIDALKTRLNKQQQSILFINRRGFAPVLYCQSCNWSATCPRCDTRLIFHKPSNSIRCHHCGHQQQTIENCPSCDHPELLHIGTGTQRIEEAVKQQFPKARLCRLDRDAVKTQADLNQRLDSIKQQKVDIIIGTQLITKGHDFPNVTLVGVINADQGLYSSDFRASEHLFQQLLQVSGRSGRAENPGEVLIQTAFPNSQTMQYIKNHDFIRFSEHALSERKMTEYPPYSFIALWRAESTAPDAPTQSLRKLAQLGNQIINQQGLSEIQLFDAVPSPMEKRAGRYRAQLMVISTHRKTLHTLIQLWLDKTEERKILQKVRWSLDIDPMDLN